MNIKTPPMGWNSWNTFGLELNDEIIRQTADRLVADGYRDAGYEYIIMDDGWMLMERSDKGLLVPDPAKFPHGIRALADYVHSKGLKLGIYSCAGTRTCGGYPSSFDHEFSDARQFADWQVDYLKYDFCNFPKSADCRQRYLTMAMALRATGRDIFFAACNWGAHAPELWMRAAGANSYRSTGDILDNFLLTADIATSQLDKMHANAAPCFNDMDMLTVGMFGKGHVGLDDPNNKAETACTETDYVTQFALWACMGSALILGADLRAMSPAMRALVQHPELIAINQDAESRPPYLVSHEDGWFCFAKLLGDGSFALVYANMNDAPIEADCNFSDVGVPYPSGWKLRLWDVLQQKDVGVQIDHFATQLPAHGVRVLRARFA